MEWRAICDCPGYEINARGVIRKESGYVLSRSSLPIVNGRKVKVNRAELLKRVFSPENPTPIKRDVQIDVRPHRPSILAPEHDKAAPAPNASGLPPALTRACYEICWRARRGFICAKDSGDPCDGTDL